MERTSCVILLLIVWINFIQMGEGADSCDFQACFPKLTTNSSKLNTLLVFGIFEVPLQEKCLSFAEADSCIRTTLSTCRGPVTLKRKFHMDSWSNAKKLFDYVCLDEYTAFREHQTCLRDLALSNGLNMCDSYFSSKTTVTDMCNLPNKVSKCVEMETRKTCPDIVVPKIVKMVDMFLNNMININQSACQQYQHSTTTETSVKVHSEDEEGAEVEWDEIKQSLILPGISVGGVRGGQTDPPIHTFIVTRRRGQRSTPKNRKGDVDDDGDDDNDFDVPHIPSVGHHGDRWYQPRDAKDEGGKVGHDNNPRGQIHHKQRPQSADNDDVTNVDEGDFGRRHSLKQDQLQHSYGSAIMTSSHISLLLSLNLFLILLHF